MRFTVKIENTFANGPVAEGTLNQEGILTISKGAMPKGLLESFQRHVSGFHLAVGIYFSKVGDTDYRIDFMHVN